MTHRAIENLLILTAVAMLAVGVGVAAVKWHESRQAAACESWGHTWGAIDNAATDERDLVEVCIVGE